MLVVARAAYNEQQLARVPHVYLYLSVYACMCVCEVFACLSEQFALIILTGELQKMH